MSVIRQWTSDNFPWCFTCMKHSVTRMINGNVAACGWCDQPREKKVKS